MKINNNLKGKKMHIHILGICGTFMGSLAVLAKELGYRVTGSDASVYPPMSTQLETQGITLLEGYDAEHLQPEPDLVIVGNAVSRGNACVEYMLNQNMTYISGPQWLAENVLHKRHVLAISGTHGKTTTSSMLAFMLDKLNIDCGYLIGGVPQNFKVSSRLGTSPYFVIEADEYDSAFFDKRSKLVHYRPRTLVINNLEFDHADIFSSLDDIQRQFHHVVRTVPSEGSVIAPFNDEAIENVLQRGCWSEKIYMSTEAGDGAKYFVELIHNDGSRFSVFESNSEGVSQLLGEINWSLLGRHNVENALSALSAAFSVGIEKSAVISALNEFSGVKRRLEKIAEHNDIVVYDDFAHHPTAIQLTLAGLRNNKPEARIVVVVEARSNTMKLGIHEETLLSALNEADCVYCLNAGKDDWNIEESLNKHRNIDFYEKPTHIVDALKNNMQSGDCIVIMSNGGFGGIHELIVSVVTK